jgi:hypothetical protein
MEEIERKQDEMKVQNTRMEDEIKVTPDFICYKQIFDVVVFLSMNSYLCRYRHTFIKKFCKIPNYIVNIY